jgi:intracellular multiplication protein IcmV
MFKKTFRAVGRVLKPLVDVPTWIGWKSLKEDQARLGRLAKSVLTPEDTLTERHRDSFDEAVVRLGLNESAILARQRYCKRLATLYLCIALALLFYAFYVWIIFGAFFGFLMTLIAVWIALALAFRQHFWYTQMKVRRLGLSFREWFLIAFISPKYKG